MANEVHTITVRQAKDVAHRLVALGLSRRETDTPEQQDLLVLAGRTIRAMSRSFQNCDLLVIHDGRETAAPTQD